jgi:hypothetical protein
MMDTACLMHDCFVWENAVGFNFWSLVWPVSGGLINQENPYASRTTWTNAPPGTPTQSHGWWYAPSYWAMKHFSYYIQPGFKRISATNTDSNVRLTGWVSPDTSRLVVVLINTNKSTASAMNFNFGTFNAGQSSVYQTAGTSYFQSLGALTNNEALPPQSITTVVLDKLVIPVVSAQMSGTNLIVSWPAANSGFILQYATDPVSGIWSPIVSPSPQVVGTNYQLALPLTNSTLYFRLAK